MVLMSLALGVAIFVSSFESVVAAQDAIAASASAMTGKAEWEVSRGRYLGIEGAMVEKIRKVPGAIAAPIIEATVSTVGAHPTNFLVVGLDLTSVATPELFGSSLDSDAMNFVKLRLVGSGMIVSRAFAEKNGLSDGSSLALESANGRREVVIVGILSSKKLDVVAGGNLGFMGLDETEQKFGIPGMVDKIAVAGVPKTQLTAVCPTCQIDPPGKLGSAAEDALGRIKSLLGISMIALLVGVLLIYNAVQVSVLERLLDIAILKSIGATRIQILSMLMAEWFLIGLIGSCFGMVIGSGLAVALVEYTKRTVNTMVPLVTEAHVHVSPTLFISAMAIGTGTALAAAFFPACAASNVRPLEILRPYSYRRVHRYRLAAGLGLALFIAANIVVAVWSTSYAVGIGITGVECFGIALLFPQVVLVAGNRLRKPFASLKNSTPFLALDSLLKSPHRTAFTIMTFGCALMMTVAAKTLVAGFQASTSEWMTTAFPFDISVMGNDLASNVYGSQVLPASLTTKVRGIAGVRDAYSVRKLFTPYQGHDVMAIGVDTDRYLAARQSKNMGFWPPELAEPTLLHRFKSGAGAFVSDNFAQLYHVHTGDKLEVDTPTGALALDVLGEVDDYSWQHGAFILDLSHLRSRWKDNAVSYIDLSVAPGFTVEDVKGRVQALATTQRAAFAYDTHQIRQAADSVLEQVVAMADLQAIIAIVIGVLGIVNAIWIGVMNRKREIALWRSIGVTRNQIQGIVVCEGLFIAAVSALVGAVGGLYGGWVPLRSFSFNVTGYLYPRVVPWVHVASVVLLAIALGILAGIFPARQASKLPILESIGYE